MDHETSLINSNFFNTTDIYIKEQYIRENFLVEVDKKCSELKISCEGFFRRLGASQQTFSKAILDSEPVTREDILTILILLPFNFREAIQFLTSFGYSLYPDHNSDQGIISLLNDEDREYETLINELLPAM